MFGPYAERHMQLKERRVKPGTYSRDVLSFLHLFRFFGRDAHLSSLTVSRLHSYTDQRLATGRASQTILHELHCLSSMFRRAIAEGAATVNPVTNMVDKPVIRRPEARWLEVHEATRMLEAASDRFRPILATFLLTGGRKLEVFGLTWADVDFGGGCIQFRPNRWRSLKRHFHTRRVPLWTQFRAILEGRAPPGPEPSHALVFPSRSGGGMLTDVRGALTAAARDAGVDFRVTLHTLRHTYCATRLQTLDAGVPVAMHTVMRELGHRNYAMIERVYGHLQTSPQRVPEPAYELSE